MIYSICRFIVLIILFPLYRIKVIGRENIPKSGPVLVCTNHISNFDPPVVGITQKRPVSFMAKGELFEKPILGPLLVKVRAFPVKRGLSDRNALRTALNILKDGNVLGLFPEGTRSKTGEVGKALAGAGFFALRSEAVVVPCAIVGPYKPFRSVRVIYGKPMDMTPFRENKASAQETADAIMNEVRKLRENAVK